MDREELDSYIERAATGARIEGPRKKGTPGKESAGSQLFSDLKPVRPLPPTPILLLFCLIPALAVVIFGEKTLGMGGWHAQIWVTRTLLFGAAGVAVATAGYECSLRMVPGSRRRFSTLAVQLAAAGVFIGTVAIAFHNRYPIDMAAADEKCFKNGLIVAAAAFALTFLATWRGVWLNRVASSLQLAALASAAAILVLTFYCPVLAASHVFVAHLGAVAVTLLIAGLGGRLIR